MFFPSSFPFSFPFFFFTRSTSSRLTHIYFSCPILTGTPWSARTIIRNVKACISIRIIVKINVTNYKSSTSGLSEPSQNIHHCALTEERIASHMPFFYNIYRNIGDRSPIFSISASSYPDRSIRSRFRLIIWYDRRSITAAIMPATQKPSSKACPRIYFGAS